VYISHVKWLSINSGAREMQGERASKMLPEGRYERPKRQIALHKLLQSQRTSNLVAMVVNYNFTNWSIKNILENMPSSFWGQVNVFDPRRISIGNAGKEKCKMCGVVPAILARGSLRTPVASPWPQQAVWIHFPNIVVFFVLTAIICYFLEIFQRFGL